MRVVRQTPVLALLRDHNMLQDLPVALGPLRGLRLGLDVPALTEALGELIRDGVLTAYAPRQPATTELPLEAVA